MILNGWEGFNAIGGRDTQSEFERSYLFLKSHELLQSWIRTDMDGSAEMSFVITAYLKSLLTQEKTERLLHEVQFLLSIVGRGTKQLVLEVEMLNHLWFFIQRRWIPHTLSL